MPILVTGCARSGTSLTTSVLRACGANLGAVNDLCENLRVRERILKPLLRQVKADPLGQFPLPHEDATPVVHDLRGKVERELPPEPWAYKGVKVALIWRPWVEAFPDAKWVIVRRDIDAIAESCLRTRFMQAYRTHDEWRAWAQHYIDRLEEIKRVTDCIEVWPSEAISGDLGGFRAMVEHCGLVWDEDAVQALIRPEKWHR